MKQVRGLPVRASIRLWAGFAAMVASALVHCEARANVIYVTLGTTLPDMSVSFPTANPYSTTNEPMSHYGPSGPNLTLGPRPVR